MADLTCNLRTWRVGQVQYETADYYRAGRYVGSAWQRTYRGRKRGWTMRADGCGRVEYWNPEFLIY